MKRYDPARADDRSIEAKSLGLIMAMDEDAADRLHDMLRVMAEKNSKRAAQFLGVKR